jgi:hypothetical protein
MCTRPCDRIAIWNDGETSWQHNYITATLFSLTHMYAFSSCTYMYIGPSLLRQLTWDDWMRLCLNRSSPPSMYMGWAGPKWILIWGELHYASEGHGSMYLLQDSFSENTVITSTHGHMWFLSGWIFVVLNLSASLLGTQLIHIKWKMCRSSRTSSSLNQNETSTYYVKIGNYPSQWTIAVQCVCSQ